MQKMRKFTSKIIIFALFSFIFITMFKKYMSSRSVLLKSKQFKVKKPGMKYILQWTNHENIPFAHMGLGQTGFIGRECEYTNCYVSADASELGSVTAYDVVMFAGPELIYDDLSLPKERLPYQKYVFGSTESPGNYPLCIHNFNSYFNWTWTYKLDSDVRWGYIVVKDARGNIIGPNKDMHWIPWKDMDPVDETYKLQLRGKRKAVAWFVSNCRSRSRREDYVIHLREELQENYSLDVDVYGECGSNVCPRDKEKECAAMISKDYYFYLSFENSFSEDYVTEKLLHALQNDAVPIVYGGANYSRFLPDRSYLNARDMGVPQLAELIYSLIQEPSAYAEFFRWRKYYSYHRTTKLKETNEYCKMCEALNNEELVKNYSTIFSFSEFWEVYETC